MLSLLYKYKEESSSIDPINELSLDLITDRVCRSEKVTKAVLELLKQPLRNPANVTYRQEICQDFIANDGLFKELKDACERYVELKGEWDKANARLRTKVGAKQFDAPSLEMIRDVIYTLENNASYCLKITSFTATLNEIFDKYHIKSEGLLSIKNFCDTRDNNKDYTRLKEIADELLKITSMIDKGCEITVDLDDSLRSAAVHLIKIKKDYQSEETTKRPSLLASIFGKSKEENKSKSAAQVSIMGDTRREMVELISESLKEISTLLVGITRSLYPPFAGLVKELVLYDFGIRLNHIYVSQGISHCYPDVRNETEDIFQCEELYDLLLVFKDYLLKHPRKDTVPNDALLAQEINGILIQGDNGSGKTTFLRAVGIAQVLAQAGLPIPARTGVISIRRKIFAHFSSEDELGVNDAAGRFEGEVQEIAEIIDQLEPYSLILLNETFQTTAFDEATYAMFDILDVISEVKVKWVFVTHLLQINAMFSDSNKQVLELRTATDEERRYKLEPVGA